MASPDAGAAEDQRAEFQKQVGKRVRVIVDESTGKSAKGRSSADAPEIDGAVHLTGRLPIRVGDLVTAKIDRADAYDLHGQVV